MRAMFESATITLTMIYIAIIAIISLFFSYKWHTVATSQLNQKINQTYRSIERIPNFRNNPALVEILDQRQEQINDSRKKISTQLLVSNLLVLGIGGVGSYVLAKKTLQPVEEAHEAQSRFTADASHELRTPIAAMRSEIEVALRDSKLTKNEAVALLKSNLEELIKLSNLSDGLLKLNDGSQAPEMTPVAIAPIFESVRLRQSKELDKAEVELQTLASGLSVISNESMLEELIMTLVSNAIKYSDPQSTVLLEAKLNKNTVTVSVKDTGIGIKASDLPHIFERFYRADATRSANQSPSYGLGLSIAKNLAESMSTKIKVESQPGVGSTFKFSLKKTN